MAITFNPAISSKSYTNKKAKSPSFGCSFPVPRHFGEAMHLRDQATLGRLLPDDAGIQSMRIALKTGKVEVIGFLEEIVQNKWRLPLSNFLD